MNKIENNLNNSNSNQEYKLSAIVLVYNGEDLLRPCLDSLVNQTIDGLEIILMNDASTDDSLSICKEYEKTYDNVFLFDKEKNGGLASSANLGIQLARGEYVILVDNDDIIPKYAYEKLYNKAKETDADVCVGKANFLTGKYQAEMLSTENIWDKEITVNPKCYPSVFFDPFYWNKIIKKRLLMDNKIRLSEDIKVICRYRICA